MQNIIETIDAIQALVVNPAALTNEDTKVAVSELSDWLMMQSLSPKSLSPIEHIVCKLAGDFVAALRDGSATISQFQVMLEAADLYKRLEGVEAVEAPPAPPPEPHSKLYIWIDGEDDRGTPQWRTRLFIDGQPADKTDKAHTYGDRDYAIKLALGEVTDGDVIVEEPQPKPYLYILMRNDLASLNAGKAVAQGTHAANQMVKEARKRKGGHGQKDRIVAMLDEWEQEANGFGTCIVLSVTERQMRQSIADAQAAGEHAGITHDPTYPLLDGQTLHLLPVDTCGYVFGYKAVVGKFLTGFPLMP